MSTELQQAILTACLALSREAMAIFDAVEADDITMDTARTVVAMGNRANEIAVGIQTLVVTGSAAVRR